MDSTMSNRLAEGQIASLEEQLSNLAREAGFNPSTPPPMKTPHAPPATKHRLADWRHVAVAGCLLAACMGVVAWWWSSSPDTAMTAPSAPIALAQAAPEAAAPKDAAPVAIAPSAALEQQLQPMARDLAAVRQSLEQHKATQDQLIRDNENLRSQLAAGREEIARNNGIIEQLRATQIQMARESQTLTERVNASQQQLARIIASAVELNTLPEEPKAMSEVPKAMSEEPKMIPEEPKVMPGTPLPRPRQPANVAQTQKPAPAAARPQAKKPQSSVSWPWSPRSP
ncbi:hypothetical protein JQ634_06615 [Bradyrhizobium sp. AUGA SZCCT0240]|nr:hypothetical protein [Bradyrhizobium sp. AUGA SZCCT0158]MBR1244451.1 hypothetical protein [Bradyrhizobium sp. AUGA SZCCT0274]MBR1253372.1 hypothetical protein [Bradyrhizobium sp. AUGA SZCCT0240]